MPLAPRLFCSTQIIFIFPPLQLTALVMLPGLDISQLIVLVAINHLHHHTQLSGGQSAKLPGAVKLMVADSSNFNFYVCNATRQFASALCSLTFGQSSSFLAVTYPPLGV